MTGERNAGRSVDEDGAGEGKDAKVLLWGFYDEGNLGDDLMAVMVAELISSLGLTPVIASGSERFARMGYRCVAAVGPSLDVAAVVLGGGAFIKAQGSSTPGIERRAEALAGLLEARPVPVIGISIGSDGVDDLRALSCARRRVLCGPELVGAAVRLRKDLRLGLTGATFLPDIVCASSWFAQRMSGAIWTRQPDGAFLINLSRRSAWALAPAFHLGRGRHKVFFLAHGDVGSGGEIWLPLFQRWRAHDLFGAIQCLRDASAIVSSKLHPGLIALSTGTRFIAVGGRPKTKALILDYSSLGLIEKRNVGRIGYRLIGRFGTAWQCRLWAGYRRFLAGRLSELGLGETRSDRAGGQA